MGLVSFGFLGQNLCPELKKSARLAVLQIHRLAVGEAHGLGVQVPLKAMFLAVCVCVFISFSWLNRSPPQDALGVFRSYSGFQSHVAGNPGSDLGLSGHANRSHAAENKDFMFYLGQKKAALVSSSSTPPKTFCRSGSRGGSIVAISCVLARVRRGRCRLQSSPWKGRPREEFSRGPFLNLSYRTSQVNMFWAKPRKKW